MDIEVNEIYSALGLETPTETPNDTPTETTPEEAAPTVPNATESQNNDGEGSGTPGKPSVQTPEENSRYAAARRRAESEYNERLERERASHNAELAEVIAAMNLTDPYTGKPITTREELREYRRHMDEESVKSSLGGASPEAIGKLIEGHPAVKEAREAAKRMNDAEREARDAEAKRRVDAQIAEISKLDPNIKTLDDLLSMESFEAFNGYVKRGVSLVEAYKLVNFDGLIGRAADMAERASHAKYASKAHLQRSPSRGEGEVSVPKEIADEYRLLMPEATDAEIQQHYNKYINSQK